MAELEIDRWLHLCDKVSNESDARDVFHVMVKLYDESTRFYHTQHHIVDCLNHFDGVRQAISDEPALELALWMHDVIYDPKASDNELQSSDFARESLKRLGFQSEMIDCVCRLIMVTQHATPISDQDEAVMCDIDLSILGAGSDRFEAYEYQIRQEYHWVDLPIYCAKRSEVLQQFLDAPSIYRTKYFHDQYESQARKNIQSSLDMLSMK